MNTAEVQNLVEVEGYLYDQDSGEVVGIAEPKPQFSVTDEPSADWVLEKMMDEEVSIVREEIKLRALTENIEKRKADHARRLAYLHYRFDNELEHFAATQLEGKKEKTLKLAFGSISFRATAGGSIAVKDEMKALEIARLQFPHAVKTTEKFLVSQLTDQDKTKIAKWSDAFEITEPKTTCSIKTGVKA